MDYKHGHLLKTQHAQKGHGRHFCACIYSNHASELNDNFVNLVSSDKSTYQFLS